MISRFVYSSRVLVSPRKIVELSESELSGRFTFTVESDCVSYAITAGVFVLLLAP